MDDEKRYNDISYSSVARQPLKMHFFRASLQTAVLFFVLNVCIAIDADCRRTKRALTVPCPN